MSERKAEHSPAPWEIWELPLDECGEQEHSYRIVAKSTLFLTVTPCSDGFQWGQNRANAYLIAAAPDLLEEVERMLESTIADIDDTPCDAGNWDGGSADSCDHCHLCRYRDHLKALIAKATGDTGQPTTPPTYTKPELNAMPAYDHPDSVGSRELGHHSHSPFAKQST